MSRRQAAFWVLGAFLVAGCDSAATSADAAIDNDATAGDSGTVYTEIQEGQGPCEQGINLTFEGKQYFVPLAVLPRTTVVVDGAQQDAIALDELLPAPVLDPLSFDGKFTTAQLRLLYDCRLAGEQAGAPEITVAPESMATGHLLVADRSVHLEDPPAGAQPVKDVCRVEALRRMLVTRDNVTEAVHVADLPTEPYVDKGSQTTAVTFDAILAASGLLGAGEKQTQFDYRLVAVDYLTRKNEAVRFPWGHGHLAGLRWVPSIARTRSIDTTGDLKNAAGEIAHQGVASEGWSSVKLLLEVVIEPAPDPAHTVTGPDGPYTDPASCHGCHEVGGGVPIPVDCAQCHPLAP